MIGRNKHMLIDSTQALINKERLKIFNSKLTQVYHSFDIYEYVNNI